MHTLLCALIALLFSPTLTSSILADSLNKTTCNSANGIFSTGPCQMTVLYCQDGKPMKMTCPQSMIFNPTSKFCEDPLSVLLPSQTVVGHAKPQVHAETSPQGPSVFIQPLPSPPRPFVGQSHMEPYLGEAVHGPLVFIPPSPVYPPQQQPYVGEAVHGPSVFIPPTPVYPPHQQQPYVGEAEHGPSVFVQPSPVYSPHQQQPYVGEAEHGPSVFVQPSPVYSPHQQQPYVGEAEHGPSVFVQSSPVYPPQQQQPYVGEAEHGPSVFVQPSSDYSPPQQEPYVGEAEIEMDSEEYDGPSAVIEASSESFDEAEHGPSVFFQPLPSPPRPFVGRSDLEPYLGEAEQGPSVFVQPSSDYSPPQQEPYVGEAEIEMDSEAYDGPSTVIEASSDNADEQRPLVDHFHGRGNDYAPKISSFALLDSPADVGHDAFFKLPIKTRPEVVENEPVYSPSSPQQQLHESEDSEAYDGPSAVIEASSDNADEQRPLVDHFHGRGNDYAPKISSFALLDSPADVGHDAFFKLPIKKRPEKSAFAPMNSPVVVGHDSFKSRRPRRSVSNTNQTIAAAAAVSQNSSAVADAFAMCRQIFAKQLATRAVNSTGKPCARDQVPHGCRQFYLACVNGQQVRRQCPDGLFYDQKTDSCKLRQQIAICQRVMPSEQLAQAAMQRQQRQKLIRPTTEQPSSGNNGSAPPTLPSGITTTTALPTINGTTILASESAFGRKYPTSVTPKHSGQKNGQAKSSSQNQRQHRPPPTYAQFYPELFCSELPDGFYRHPRNCSRIIQCFGHQLFEYPSCQHDLAFNEQLGVCDYRPNVQGCALLPDSVTSTTIPQSSTPSSSADVAHRLTTDDDHDQQAQNLSGNGTSSRNANASSSSSGNEFGTCKGGHSHGDHIEHPEHCSAFLRCTWGRLVTMSCPRGTAFNPRLSVCDYPDQVPNCHAA